MALRGCIPWNKGRSCIGVSSKDKTYARAYYANNREKLLLATKEWQAKNVDKVIQTRKKHRQKAKDVINAIKESTPCTDCKKKYPAVVMDFDHVHGNKTKEVSAYMRGGNLIDALEEIKKCELVCANCHRLRTESRRIAKLKK